MVKVILGDKGSGNTKELMKTIGETLAQDQGSIVCIEKGNDLTYDVSHEVRLISARDYGIESFTFLKGFISGLYAGNYDITHIFIDSLTKIIGRECDFETEKFLDWLNAFSQKNGIKFTITISDDIESADEVIKSFF